MKAILLNRYAGTLVFLGGLVALTCLASTWYINRLQADLARAVRHDVARMEGADELQLHLRQLRLHTLLHAADPTSARMQLVDDDRRLVEAAIAAVASECDTPEDQQLLDTVTRGYREYELSLGLDALPGPPARSGDDLIRWADAHPVRGLLDRCHDFEDRQRQRMNASLERSETQTTWAGRVLLGLGVVGALGGLLSGFATARGLSRRTAQLSVRVHAVQAQLDQEVGAMTVEGTQSLDELNEQMDRVVVRVRDVCRRLQEQERDLLRAEQLGAVGHLAAGLAHEIRNPLTGIKLLVEGAMRANRPTPLATEDLALIHQEVVRIGRTVQGLLDFARTPRPDRKRHDLAGLLEEAAGIAQSRAKAKPVRLAVALDSRPLPANVDRDQMISLLTNLLFNAVDATPPGGEVRATGTVNAEGQAIIAVTDTGPGIEPGIEGRLFTPFATTKPTGTGLGLSVARRIAEEHGGTLTAANRPESGACFTLTLPADS